MKKAITGNNRNQKPSVDIHNQEDLAFAIISLIKKIKINKLCGV